MARRRPYGRSSGDRRSRPRPESWFEQNPVTALTMVFGALFVFGLPQVSRIVFDLPELQDLTFDTYGLWAALHWVYFLTLTGTLLTACWSMLDQRPLEEEAGAEVTRTGPVRLIWLWIRLHQRVGVLLLPLSPLAIASRGGRGPRRGAGLMGALGGAAVVLFANRNPRLRLGAFDSVTLELVGWLATLCGLWLLFGRVATDPGRPRLPREAARWDHGVRFWHGAQRSLELLLASLLFGELVWAVVAEHSESSWRFYTLWGTQELVLYAVLFGRLADSWGRRPTTRLAAGGGLAVLLAGLASFPSLIGSDPERCGTFGQRGRPTVEQELAADGQRAADLTEAWFDQIDRRLARLDALIEGEGAAPVIFVAASGGGTRAAVWTTWALEALGRTPIPGTDERATLADAVLFLSTVSGGSMGGTNWVLGGGGTQGPAPETLDPVNASAFGLDTGYFAALSRVCDLYDAQADELEASGVVVEACEEGAPSLFEPQNTWPVTSVRADEVAADLNSPLLRGILLPGLGRGESIERFWERYLHWPGYGRCGTELEPLRADVDACEGLDCAKPLLLINSVEVHTGFRLVSGQPSLPPGLLWDRGAPEFHARAEAGRDDDDPPPTTTQELRAEIYWGGLNDPSGLRTRAISDLDPELRVSPAEAVRMSANFPWGFDLPRLALRLDHARLRGLQKRPYVVDGGVLDNTGIDTLSTLLSRLMIVAYRSDEPLPRLQPRARKLLAELARRGVVVLEIDSGARPDDPGVAEAALSQLLLPVSALSQASYVRNQNARSLYVQEMSRNLSIVAAQLPAEPRPTPTPEPIDTAPALGPLAPADPADAGPTRVGAAVTTQVSEPALTELEAPAFGHRLAHLAIANRGESIMTALALNSSQLGELMFRFRTEDDRERDELLEDWEALRGQNLLRAAASDELSTPPARRLLAQLQAYNQAAAPYEVYDILVQRQRRDSLWVDAIGAPAPSAATAPPEGAWLFVGYRPADEWLTGFLEFARDEDPETLVDDTWTTAHRLPLFAVAPDPYGVLLPHPDSLAKGTAIGVTEVVDWAKTGLYFAKVGAVPE